MATFRAVAPVGVHHAPAMALTNDRLLTKDALHLSEPRTWPAALSDDGAAVLTELPGNEVLSAPRTGQPDFRQPPARRRLGEKHQLFRQAAHETHRNSHAPAAAARTGRHGTNAIQHEGEPLVRPVHHVPKN